MRTASPTSKSAACGRWNTASGSPARSRSTPRPTAKAIPRSARCICPRRRRTPPNSPMPSVWTRRSRRAISGWPSPSRKRAGSSSTKSAPTRIRPTMRPSRAPSRSITATRRFRPPSRPTGRRPTRIMMRRSTSRSAPSISMCSTFPSWSRRTPFPRSTPPTPPS